MSSYKKVNSRDFFVTSDTHLGHANIIKYCDRPFNSVEHMNRTLIDNINIKVPPRAILFHIGDFALGTPEQIRDMVRSINATVCLVRGNHDKKVEHDICKDEFEWIKDYHEVTVKEKDTGKKQFIVLCHYAFRVYNKSHHNAWNLYGHSHGSLSEDKRLLSMDVGVDTNNYTPYSYNEIKKIMATKDCKPTDYHNRNTTQ